MKKCFINFPKLLDDSYRCVLSKRGINLIVLKNQKNWNHKQDSSYSSKTTIQPNNGLNLKK